MTLPPKWERFVCDYVEKQHRGEAYGAIVELLAEHDAERAETTLPPRWERFLASWVPSMMSTVWSGAVREDFARVLAEHDAERAETTLPAKQPAPTVHAANCPEGYARQEHDGKECCEPEPAPPADVAGPNEKEGTK